MKSNWGQRSLRAEAKYLLVSNNQQKLKRAGRRRWGWLPGQEWAAGLTCVDDVADCPWAQGVIEWDHHHRVCVAGKLRDDPLWRHTGWGEGGEHRADSRAALPSGLRHGAP